MNSSGQNRRLYGRVAVCALTALLFSCAAQPVFEPVDNPASVWEANSRQLYEISDWSLAGRASIKIEGEGWSMNLTWKQSGEKYQIDMFGPLGTGRIKLIGRPGAVTLNRGDDSELTATNPEALMQQELGWSLPVSGMRYWVMGLVGNNTESKPILNRDGTAKHLRQNGWDIRFDRYQKLDGIGLPGRVQMVNGSLRLKLIIDNWELKALPRQVVEPEARR